MEHAEWECVVEKGQAWRKGGVEMRVLDVARGRLDGRLDAMVTFMGPAGTSTERASSICGSSLWERLPS